MNTNRFYYSIKNQDIINAIGLLPAVKIQNLLESLEVNLVNPAKLNTIILVNF